MDAVAIARACAQAMWADDAASRGLDMQLIAVEPGHAVVGMEVTGSMVNGHELCHGGYIFLLADTAFAFACNTGGRVTMSIENGITYPAPAHTGDLLTAVAREDTAGRRLGFYAVRVTNQRNELVALFHGTAYRTSQQHPAGDG